MNYTNTFVMALAFIGNISLYSMEIHESNGLVNETKKMKESEFINHLIDIYHMTIGDIKDKYPNYMNHPTVKARLAVSRNDHKEALTLLLEMAEEFTLKSNSVKVTANYLTAADAIKKDMPIKEIIKKFIPLTENIREAFIIKVTNVSAKLIKDLKEF